MYTIRMITKWLGFSLFTLILPMLQLLLFSLEFYFFMLSNFGWAPSSSKKSHLPVHAIRGVRFHIIVDVDLIYDLLFDVLAPGPLEDVVLVQILGLVLVLLAEYLVHGFEMGPVGIHGAYPGSSLHGPLNPVIQTFQIPDPGLNLVWGSVKSAMLHIGGQQSHNGCFSMSQVQFVLDLGAAPQLY